MVVSSSIDYTCNYLQWYEQAIWKTVYCAYVQMEWDSCSCMEGMDAMTICPSTLPDMFSSSKYLVLEQLSKKESLV